MEKMKHTPGPWNMRPGMNGLSWFVEEPKTLVNSSESNARLIAAAPELLEAAKAGDYLGDKLGAGIELPPALIAEKLRIIRTAIAKAEGGRYENRD